MVINLWFAVVADGRLIVLTCGKIMGLCATGFICFIVSFKYELFNKNTYAFFIFNILLNGVCSFLNTNDYKKIFNNN